MTGHLVVGVDGSAEAQVALRWAITFAAAADATVEAVTAWRWARPAFGLITPDTPVEVALAATALAADQVSAAGAALPEGLKAVSVRPRAREGDAASVLLAAGGDLLVVGRHGSSPWMRHLPRLLGSVAHQCLRASHAPVVVTPPDCPSQAPARFVVGVDGSAQSGSAVQWAVRHGALLGVPVVAVMAWQLTTLPAPVSARLAGPVPPLSDWEEQAQAIAVATVSSAVGDDHQVECVTLHASAPEGLLTYLTPQDVLVVGARGLGGIAAHLLGSVSRRCAQEAPCPVVVVPTVAGA